jgi:hypothetical protein
LLQGKLLLSTDTRLILVLTLLPFIACITGAEEVLAFPTYVQGKASFPSNIIVAPVFFGNYGLIASGDTLYHMELRHGRIHGKTPAGGPVTALAVSGTAVFAMHDSEVFRLNGFEVSCSCTLPDSAKALTVCGNYTAVLLTDGSIALYNGSDLSSAGNYTPPGTAVTRLQGFPGALVLGYADGRILSVSIPSFSVLADKKLNGSLLFMNRAGDSNLLFSTDAWNETAVCSPSDLVIQVMFTFPETPVSAASDSVLSCVYAVCPSTGLQVCLKNGEIAWKTAEYGTGPLVVVSDDCEQVLVADGNSATLLVK